ncbi:MULTISPECIES: hypothetical protein [unclassified Arcicella]|uniref:hypothetical protein n=1 Tax=unclassified Arcicella TaxID=2644986 RepID=UPI002854745D|nr:MULTISPECIES: hypothetical protein [unclassified Arcicella]MDR6563510.1 hypothetical protein [Arcicella sp. BE51]MDR6813378.1 hypothetical protein [Arcicella sp. BE140]MDR6824691.1 hypothetical protein [Arcicella sp. BE139]
MELDDLKNTWEKANTPSEKQRLTPQIIDQMTQQKYDSKMKKIAYPEIVGIAICLIGGAFIAINFYKLDTAFLQGVGVLSIMLLLTLSGISLLSLRQFGIYATIDKPYAETLKMFASQKMQFFKLQKINVTLCYLLLVTVIILLSKLFNGKDLTDSKSFWIFSFTIGYIFLLFYSKWVAKFYQKTLRETEELLAEL